MFKTSSSIKSISWLLLDSFKQISRYLKSLDLLITRVTVDPHTIVYEALNWPMMIRRILVIKSIPENVISNVTSAVEAEIEMLKKWKRVKNGI